MLELSTDLIRRALLVESKNGERSVFNVVYDYSDGSQEEMFVKVQRSDKLEDGRFNFFEAVEVREGLLNDEQVFFSEILDSGAGDVFKLDEDGVYVNEGDWGRGVATLVQTDARIFTSYVMLILTSYVLFPDSLNLYMNAFSFVDEEFPGLLVGERFKKVRQFKEILLRDSYAGVISDDSIERVTEQVKVDNDMISAFPDWVPEYDSGE